MNSQIHLTSEEQTLQAGGDLADRVRAQHHPFLVIYLVGDLGAGKTTFVRGFLRALGHPGRVPSPTYTLVEPYELAGYAIAHIDLYRLQSVGEATALALDEPGDVPAILLIEWPDKGAGEIPPADLLIELDIAPAGRHLRLNAATAAGEPLITTNNL